MSEETGHKIEDSKGNNVFQITCLDHCLPNENVLVPSTGRSDVVDTGTLCLCGTTTKENSEALSLR